MGRIIVNWTGKVSVEYIRVFDEYDTFCYHFKLDRYASKWKRELDKGITPSWSWFEGIFTDKEAFDSYARHQALIKNKFPELIVPMDVRIANLLIPDIIPITSNYKTFEFRVRCGVPLLEDLTK